NSPLRFRQAHRRRTDRVDSVRSASLRDGRQQRPDDRGSLRQPQIGRTVSADRAAPDRTQRDQETAIVLAFTPDSEVAAQIVPAWSNDVFGKRTGTDADLRTLKPSTVAPEPKAAPVAKAAPAPELSRVPSAAVPLAPLVPAKPARPAENRRTDHYYEV